MSNINELLYAAYVDAGATALDLPTAEYQALVAAGASDGTWYTFLRTQGYDGDVGGMLYKYLGDKGYTGVSLNERIAQAAAALDLFGGWTPADIPGVVDYGISTDLSRLKQLSDGTVAVANVDDPVGYWQGQLGVLALVQTSAGSKPKYATDGVYFLAGGTIRTLAGSLPVANVEGSPGAWAVRDTATALSAAVLTGGMCNGTGTIGGLQHMVKSVSGGTLRYSYRGGITTVALNPLGIPGTWRNHIVTGSGTASTGYHDGEAVTLSVGTTTRSSAKLLIGSATTTGACKASFWLYSTQDISASDAALLHAWMATV